MHTLTPLATVALLLLTALPAHADLVIPEPEVKPDCRLEAIQTEGRVCEVCTASRGDACALKYKETAFAMECKTEGASSWNEIWCRPEKPEATGQAKLDEGKDSATTGADGDEKEGKEEATASDKKAADLKTANPTKTRDGCQTAPLDHPASTATLSLLIGLALLGLALRSRRAR